MKHFAIAGTICCLLAAAGESRSIRRKPAKKPSDSVVVMKTSLGTVTLKLFPKHSPLTVKNFLRYVDKKFYDGTIFHRVIPNFMIQGGGFTPGLKEKAAGDPVKNEAANGLSNKRGTLAMARTSDPNSATCQFFINVKDNNFLDPNGTNPGYCVFGKVVKGMGVIDRIKAVHTQTRGVYQNVPIKDVVIKSIRRAKE
jgi:cyclophilin family peptidyl-prolyl cis-trans isomerase